MIFDPGLSYPERYERRLSELPPEAQALQRKLEEGRGTPTSPPDSDCTKCYGTGNNLKEGRNIFCDCRYRKS